VLFMGERVDVRVRNQLPESYFGVVYPFLKVSSP